MMNAVWLSDINYCPFCGSDEIDIDNHYTTICEECGAEFNVLESERSKRITEEEMIEKGYDGKFNAKIYF